MADNQEQEAVVIHPFTVPRNGVEGEFIQHKVNRGEKSKGIVYPAPTINEANVDVWYGWIGKQGVAGILQSFMKRIAQGWNKNATKDGEFNLEKFIEHAKSFSVVGETMKVLNERLRELQLELARTPITKIATLPDSDPEKIAFFELAQRIQSVSAAIENKRRDKTDGETEDDEEKNAEPVSSV